MNARCMVWGLLVTGLLTALCAGTEFPANVRVWTKPVNADGKIVMERACIYDAQQPNSWSHFQYSFFLERGKDRTLLWLWPGWAFGLSAPQPDPEIQPLDAKVTERGDLLILYNQYRRCWAFQVVDNGQGSWTMRPWSANASDRIPPRPFSLGPAMSSGSIGESSDGELQVECTNEKGVLTHYRLSRTDDHWSAIE